MATRNCPYCKVKSHMTPLEGYVTNRNGEVRRYSSVYQCDECKRLNIASTFLGEDFYLEYSEGIIEKLEVSGQPLEWHPTTVAGKTFVDVPEHIAPAANEAFECHSVGAYRGAVMLARAVIEASAKDKDVVRGTLFNKIDELVTQGHVRQMMADAAHEVRIAGNDMAHGDFATEEISEEDSEEILGFMEDFLREMFEIPTRVKRRQERRA